MEGLRERRHTLKAAEWYQAWHSKHKAEGLSLLSTGTEEEGGEDGPLSDDGRQHAAALLSAIDAALLGLRFDSMGKHENLAFHFATYAASSSADNSSGAKIPAAQWMHAVLKYGQYQKVGGELEEAICSKSDWFLCSVAI